jgi:hypothetical protein
MIDSFRPLLPNSSGSQPKPEVIVVRPGRPFVLTNLLPLELFKHCPNEHKGAFLNLWQSRWFPTAIETDFCHMSEQLSAIPMRSPDAPLYDEVRCQPMCGHPPHQE